MSPASGAGSYRALLTLPFALRTFAPATAGRLAYGVFPLAILFTAQQATDSYATAGLAAAGFGLTTFLLPAKARLAERYGQRVVLPPQALACAAALSGAAVVREPVALVVLSALAGLAAPPLGPAMRANWRRLTAGTPLKPRAYGLDSVVEETLYLVGPLLAGLLVAAGPARWALVLTAALLLVGTIGLAASPPAGHRERTGSGPEAGRRLFDLGPLRSPGLRGLLAVLLAVGAGAAAAYTGLAATAQNYGRPGVAGLLEASLAAGNVVGGLLWARRDHGRRHARQLAMLAGAVAAGLIAAAAMPGPVTLGLVLGATGVALAPVYVVAYLAADDIAGEEFATEAGTWVNVAANAGGSAGAAAAGAVADSFGAGSGFLFGGVLLAATAATVALTAGRRSRSDRVGSASAPDRTVAGVDVRRDPGRAVTPP